MEQLDEKRGYHHTGLNMNRGYHHNFYRNYPRRNYYPRMNYYPVIRPIRPIVYYPTYNGYGYNYTNQPSNKVCKPNEDLVKQNDDSYRCEPRN